MAGLAAILVANVSADESPSVLHNPTVVAAIKAAWRQTMNGRFGTEASFRLDGNPTAFRIVATPPSNQFRHHSVEIIPRATFAVFHVHTAKGEPAPSPADRSIADHYKLKMYTIHVQGLYEYDPVLKKTTKVRDGVKWMN